MADEPKIDVFEMMLKPDPEQFKVQRLQLGLVLDTAYSYIKMNKKIAKSPNDPLVNSSANMMEEQLMAAIMCLYDSIPPEDRRSLRFEMLKTLVDNPKKLPQPPKLEDME